VHRGESRLSPAIARKVMEQFRTLSTRSPDTSDVSAFQASPLTKSPGAPHSPHMSEEPLNPKETRILALLAEGKSNKQIAVAVFLAEGTVKNYVSRIMDKLHASSRVELAMRAVSRRM